MTCDKMRPHPRSPSLPPTTHTFSYNQIYKLLQHRNMQLIYFRLMSSQSAFSRCSRQETKHDTALTTLYTTCTLPLRQNTVRANWDSIRGLTHLVSDRPRSETPRLDPQPAFFHTGVELFEQPNTPLVHPTHELNTMPVC